MEKKKSIIGFLFSSLSWWACVLGGQHLEANHQLIAFTILVLFSFVLHFSLFVEFVKPFLLFYFVSLLVGLLGDGLFLKLDLFQTKGNTIGPFPLWLLTLWLIFPFNFLHSFKKLIKKPLLGILFGAIGGPLAYSAGPAFGILALSQYALIAVGVFWVLYMLFIHWLNKSLPL